MSTPEPTRPLVRVTRIDAATGQLESAILLWFLEGDLAAIHTLAAAAQELLHHTGKPAGKPSKLVSMINAEGKAFANKVRHVQNFFKHPKNHPVLDYDPLIGEFFIIDAIAVYEDIGHPLTPLMKLFTVRFAVTYPALLRLDFVLAKFPVGLHIDYLRKLGRPDFMKEVMLHLQ